MNGFRHDSKISLCCERCQQRNFVHAAISKTKALHSKPLHGAVCSTESTVCVHSLTRQACHGLLAVNTTWRSRRQAAELTSLVALSM